MKEMERLAQQGMLSLNEKEIISLESFLAGLATVFESNLIFDSEKKSDFIGFHIIPENPEKLKLRADYICASLPQKQLLSNAVSKQGSYFRTVSSFTQEEEA